ncbi:MAG: hypothetical protein ABSA72_01570 [Nitrososphaerales archaeon]|jgi:hypothetical protein
MTSEAGGEHAKALAVVAEQLGDVIEGSEQSVYIYLDDVSKVCNRNFAALLGYKSPKEWAAVKENFPDAFVSKKSQRTLIAAYQSAVTRFVGSTIKVTWKGKDGKEVETTTILVPIVYGGHAMALHFIEATKKP